MSTARAEGQLSLHAELVHPSRPLTSAERLADTQGNLFGTGTKKLGKRNDGEEAVWRKRRRKSLRHSALSTALRRDRHSRSHEDDGIVDTTPVKSPTNSARNHRISLQRSLLARRKTYGTKTSKTFSHDASTIALRLDTIDGSCLI